MKNLLTIFMICVTCIVSAQTIPNASFENWHPYSVAGEYPDFWTTSDSISNAYSGGSTAFQGSDAYDGTKSLHLKSTQISVGITITGPGIATNGQINLVGLNFVYSGGSPDTARSRYLNGWYKYLPQGPLDSGQIIVGLFKYNGSARDTIAFGIQRFGGNVTSFSPFFVEMIYQDYTRQPDTCLIIIQSSLGFNDPNLAIGTELIIDSINFTGFVGLNELASSITSVNIFPSPAQDYVYVDVVTKNNIALDYSIYDLNGRLVATSRLKSNHERIDVGDLAEGNYVVKISSNGSSSLYSKNISITR